MVKKKKKKRRRGSERGKSNGLLREELNATEKKQDRISIFGSPKKGHPKKANQKEENAASFSAGKGIYGKNNKDATPRRSPIPSRRLLDNGVCGEVPYWPTGDIIKGKSFKKKKKEGSKDNCETLSRYL